VISRMVDVVMSRTYEQSKIERFAAYSRVPVINGLTNEYHPCQILADIFTYLEHRGPIAAARWHGLAMPTIWRTPGSRRRSFSAFQVNVSTPPAMRSISGSRRPDRTSPCSRIRWTPRVTPICDDGCLDQHGLRVGERGEESRRLPTGASMRK